MRTLTILASVALAAGLATRGAIGQDPAPVQDPSQEKKKSNLAPFTAFAEAEMARMSEAIKGAWILTDFESPDGVFDPKDFRGYATFNDGYMSMSFQGRELRPSFFSGPVAYTIQAGLHRYRITTQTTLQTAAVMGYYANADSELTFERSGLAREYSITLEDKELILSHATGNKFTYRRMTKTEFPSEAEMALDRARASTGQSYWRR